MALVKPEKLLIFYPTLSCSLMSEFMLNFNARVFCGQLAKEKPYSCFTSLL